MQVWFIYFWAFKFQSWLAFVPMLPAFLLLLVQASKILEKAKTTNDY
jgi:hypothetical protein